MITIDHNKLTLGIDEQNAAAQVLSSSVLANGKQVSLFEQEICQLLNLPKGHAVATSTGSSALFLALTTLKSQRVVMPSYVCNSLKQAADLAHVSSDIIDITESSTRICPKALSKSTADTLIYPYLYGQTSKLPKFSGFIIEDIAQALGAKINGNALGTQGDIGVLSFYATKLITSGGQGGMVVSKNKEYIDFIRDYLDFDMQTGQKAHFNLPLTEIQAAIGRVQLSKLNKFIHKREQIWQVYLNFGLPLLDISEENSQPVRYRAVLLTKHAKALIKHLSRNHIKTIVPIEQSELLSQSEHAIFLSNNTISLPIYPNLSLKEAQKIARLCQNFLK